MVLSFMRFTGVGSINISFMGLGSILFMGVGFGNSNNSAQPKLEGKVRLDFRFRP